MGSLGFLDPNFPVWSSSGQCTTHQDLKNGVAQGHRGFFVILLSDCNGTTSNGCRNWQISSCFKAGCHRFAIPAFGTPSGVPKDPPLEATRGTPWIRCHLSVRVRSSSHSYGHNFGMSAHWSVSTGCFLARQPQILMVSPGWAAPSHSAAPAEREVSRVDSRARRFLRDSFQICQEALTLGGDWWLQNG